MAITYTTRPEKASSKERRADLAYAMAQGIDRCPIMLSTSCRQAGGHEFTATCCPLGSRPSDAVKGHRVPRSQGGTDTGWMCHACNVFAGETFVDVPLWVRPMKGDSDWKDTASRREWRERVEAMRDDAFALRPHKNCAGR